MDKRGQKNKEKKLVSIFSELRVENDVTFVSTQPDNRSFKGKKGKSVQRKKNNQSNHTIRRYFGSFSPTDCNNNFIFSHFSAKKWEDSLNSYTE